jgi:hypothetical protein
MGTRSVENDCDIGFTKLRNPIQCVFVVQRLECASSNALCLYVASGCHASTIIEHRASSIWSPGRHRETRLPSTRIPPTRQRGVVKIRPDLEKKENSAASADTVVISIKSGEGAIANESFFTQTIGYASNWFSTLVSGRAIPLRPFGRASNVPGERAGANRGQPRCC